MGVDQWLAQNEFVGKFSGRDKLTHSVLDQRVDRVTGDCERQSRLAKGKQAQRQAQIAGVWDQDGGQEGAQGKAFELERQRSDGGNT